MACPIEDYALIGDRETAVLVGRDGSIDWLCWPRFDSTACFAALLGSRDNGRWLIGAADPQARIRRRYRDSTLILETAIETADGAATVLDFMPPRDQASAIVRLVSGRRGRLAMRTELIIRFDYGSLTPWVTRLHDGSLRAVARPDMVVLRTPAPLRGVDFKTVGEFTISAGESVPFVLSYGPSYLPPPQPIDPAKALATTETIWSDWISKAHTAGEWSEAVSRSLITLKALTYHPSGAIAAAPTTSLRATTRQVATL
jgi:GH15 family glucan-1,4-alpha-glucosidase